MPYDTIPGFGTLFQRIMTSLFLNIVYAIEPGKLNY